jgi:RNA polymerase sigma-70 factor (ECF subfamily)
MRRSRPPPCIAACRRIRADNPFGLELVHYARMGAFAERRRREAGPVIFCRGLRIMEWTVGKSTSMNARHRQQHFESLLRDHHRIAFKVAGLYSRSAADREDLLQEISTQLWRSFDHYDPARAKFSTWMYRIALNVAISQARRWRDTDRFEPLALHHLETVGGGEGIPEQDERLSALYAFIGQLDALNRALILLYLDDKDYGEIAEILGISQTNVATKISRIKQKLRGQMTAAQTT